MNKKVALVLAAVLACGMCASCGEKKDENLGVSIEVEEENTEKTIELNGATLPGIDQTTTLINVVMFMNGQENRKLEDLVAYTDADKSIIMTSEELFGKKSETGMDYTNAVIKREGEQADIDKVNADNAGKLKGTAIDYNEVILSVTNFDDGECVDLLVPMVLIDENWCVLDMNKVSE